jgi:hypothetical protein
MIRRGRGDNIKVAKDSDQSAGTFETEKAGPALAGFLAEENGFDRRLLWRTGTWGVAAVAAVTVAVMANQASIGLRHDRSAASELLRQAQQLQSVSRESQNETRRLAAAVDTLNGDRDRLYSRVTILEQGLDSVTGAIARQGSAASGASPGAITPAPWPAAPKSQVPSVTAPADSSPVAATEELPLISSATSTMAVAPTPITPAATAIIAEPRMEVAKLEPKPDVKPEAKLDPPLESKPTAETRPEPKAVPKAEAKTEAKPEAKTEAKPEGKAETKSDFKSENRNDAKAEPKPEVRPAASVKGDLWKPDASKPDWSKSSASKSAARPDSKLAAKSEARPDARSEAKSKPESKSEFRGEKTDAKTEPDVKAESKTELKPEPKTETFSSAPNVAAMAPSTPAPTMTSAALTPSTSAPATSFMGSPDSAAGKSEAATQADPSAAPGPDVVAALFPKAKSASEGAARLPAQRTEFAVELGGANSVSGLRALWRGLRYRSGLTDLHPIIVVREANTGLGMQLRLAAGPLHDAATAAKICASLAENARPCETTVFDGQRLAMSADEVQAPLAGRSAGATKRNTPRHVTSEKDETPPPKPEAAPSSFTLFGGAKR